MILKNKLIIRTVSAITLTALLALVSGCASIVHSGDRSLAINTSPTGAKVTITKANTGEAIHSGQTPLTVALSPRGGFFKGQSYNLKLELEGYQSTDVAIKPQLSGWYIGNLVFGGLLGMLIVDPATGAMWNLTPSQIEQELTQEQASLISNKSGFIVTLIEQTTAGERENMTRIN